MPLAEIPLCVWRTQSRRFSYQGHSIRYWTAGKGEPLLLLHGFPTASWDWHYLWAPLAQRFRVIACDMLGFGDSDKPLDHDFTLLGQADLQQALLAHLNVSEPVHLLAHDIGGSVAQELLCRHHAGEARVASCVWLNCGLFPDSCALPWVHKLLLSPFGWLVGRTFGREDLVRHVAQVYGPCTRPSESAIDDAWSLILSNRGPRILHKLMAFVPERRTHVVRWTRALQRDGVPLRLIAGAADPMSGTHVAEQYRHWVPDADVIVLPDIGHYPHTEAPVQVLRHYLAFRAQPLAHLPQRVAWS